MSDLQIILSFVGFACGLALIIAPLVLLSAINRKLERIATSCEASQYLLEKNDERMEKK